MMRVRAQGSSLRVEREKTGMDYLEMKLGGGGKRSRVRTFSRASRRRLMSLFQKFDIRKVKTTLVTLTYHVSPGADVAKADLKALFQHVRRHWSHVSGVWRMEHQKRGTIHFHIIFFNLPYWKQADLQSVWERITHQEVAIVDIRLVRNQRQMMNYVSKYVAKVASVEAVTSLDESTYQHAGESTFVGRFWGVFQRNRLPFAKVNVFEIYDSEMERYLFWAVHVVSGGRTGKSFWTRELWSNEVGQMVDFLLKNCEYEELII